MSMFSLYVEQLKKHAKPISHKYHINFNSVLSGFRTVVLIEKSIICRKKIILSVVRK
jgi:hypothetical protein